jgi:hypothetical protein
MIMKNFKISFLTFAIAIAFIACDENEIMPSYTKAGTATTTVATITPSKTKAAKSEPIAITLRYVNPAADPIQSVELKAKIGATGNYVTVQTFDAQSANKDAEITHQVTYVTPATAATVTFDMVITSQKEFPQIKRATVTVQ